MATLDLSKAAQSIDLGDPHLVAFGARDGIFTRTATSWRTPGYHDVDVKGLNLRIDLDGQLVGGLVTSIAVDIGDNDSVNPDIVIGGDSFRAATLDDGGHAFWQVLAGDDIIHGADVARAGQDAQFRLFGDGISTLVAASTGGNDAIHTGSARATILGDVINVVNATQDAGATVFTGGDDSIEGQTTDRIQVLVGDAQRVFADARLIGGDDTIFFGSSNTTSAVYGDAEQANGDGGKLAEVIGGDDTISGLNGARGQLFGDVGSVGIDATLQGGADLIAGADKSEALVGDARDSLGEVTGGHDVLIGYDGDDLMVGDVYTNVGLLVGGNDDLYGDVGNDTLYGDVGNDLGSLVGGNDRLYGGSGRDILYGNDGDDLLLGSPDADRMYGGKGNDSYFVESDADIVGELDGEGLDTLWSSLEMYVLGANVERLASDTASDFTGRGNELSNTIQGNLGNDRLIADGSGVDRFIGNAGFDIMDFRDLGRVVLNLSTGVHGGAAAGDYFNTLESFFGSNTHADDMTGGSAGVSFSGFGGNDTLRGGSAEDTLYGGVGNDKLYGGAGNDTFLGGDVGNDTLDGGAGIDGMLGGLGNDTYYVDHVADAADEAQNEGIDKIVSTVSYSLDGRFTEILALAGTATINATGSVLDDRLVGNAGRNVLNGLGGRDALAGGDGADKFVFDQVGLLASLDTISDFDAADDLIQLDDSAFTGLSVGRLSAAAFRANTSGAAEGASDRIIYETDTGKLYFDQDGDGGTYDAIHFASLRNEETITYRDFSVI